MPRSRFGQTILPVVALTLALVGCGGSQITKRTDVKGKVTLNGKSLNSTDYVISFIGPDNNAVTSEIGADGEYRASGVQVGENRVLVLYSPKDNPDMPKKPQDRPEPPREDRTKAKASSRVPEKYSDLDKTILKFTAEDGSANTYNVDMKGSEPSGK